MNQLPPIFYMRDDHTVRRLEGLVDEMIIQCKEEFDAGYAHGTLCSRRSGFAEVRATGKKNWPAFEEAAHRALVAASSVRKDERDAREFRNSVIRLNCN